MISLITKTCICLFSGLLNSEVHSQASTRSQYFIVTPQNQTLNEGDTIILQCQVGNLQGVVQWTRNGFAMGKLFWFKTLIYFATLLFHNILMYVSNTSHGLTCINNYLFCIQRNNLLVWQLQTNKRSLQKGKWNIMCWIISDNSKEDNHYKHTNTHVYICQLQNSVLEVNYTLNVYKPLFVSLEGKFYFSILHEECYAYLYAQLYI